VIMSGSSIGLVTPYQMQAVCQRGISLQHAVYKDD